MARIAAVVLMLTAAAMAAHPDVAEPLPPAEDEVVAPALADVTMESLRQEFEAPLLQRVRERADWSHGDVLRWAGEAARATYDKHPDLLRAEAQKALAAPPRLLEGAMAGYRAKANAPNFDWGGGLTWTTSQTGASACSWCRAGRLNASGQQPWPGFSAARSIRPSSQSARC